MWKIIHNKQEILYAKTGEKKKLNFFILPGFHNITEFSPHPSYSNTQSHGLPPPTPNTFSLPPLYSWLAGLDILLFLRVMCHAARNSVHLNDVKPQAVSFTIRATRTAGAKRSERKRRPELRR